MNPPPDEHLAALARGVEQAYARVHREHMLGLPVVQPGLRVQMLGLRRWDELALGVLVTPWCMNLLALELPGGRSLPRQPVGSPQILRLPSGSYRLLAAHTQGLGHHLSGSLFSPMHEFASHELAVQAAQAALEMVFTPPPPAPDRARRGFLFGAT